MPAGVGQIVAKLNGDSIADIDLRMCWVDGRGVIEHVRAGGFDVPDPEARMATMLQLRVVALPAS